MIDGRIARIEFRDAVRRNALDEPALASLVAAIARTAETPGCDALVLAGEGPAF
jgi:enoyl-CoA hydratase/carnithine racemase